MKIDTHVPMPVLRKYTNRKLTLAKMEIGDSIEIPEADLKNWRGAATQYKNRHPRFNYCTRIVTAETHRLWRVPCDSE